MQTITEKSLAQGLADRFIRTEQLKRLLNGSDKRRYGLVNRALKSGELLQFQRGLFLLADCYRNAPAHPFALAQALSPGSFISFETALSYHGWIPENVFTTSSVVPGRKSRRYKHENMGNYSFHPLATEKGSFLELVNRYKLGEHTVLIAQPLRALMDLVSFRKISWTNTNWLTEGLRIDLDLLINITKKDINTLKKVYKHKRTLLFLTSLFRELHSD